MSITKKTFYIFITIFIIAILIIGVFREKAISNMKGIVFGNISHTQAKNIASLLEENQKRLLNNAKDWGYWGANYSFLNGKIDHFIKNTFEGNNALTNLDIDYMFFFDKNKKLFYARSREGLVDKEITSLPKFFENLKDIIDFKSPSSMLYLSRNGKVFNVAFSPIGKSDMKSVKPNGIFVVVKLVDKNFFINKKIKNIEISIANKETSSFMLLDGFPRYYFNFSNQKEILNTQVVYNQSKNNNIIFTLATNQSKIISIMVNTSYKVFATMLAVILFFMLFLYYFIVRKRVQKLDVLSNNIVSLSNSKDGLEQFPTFEDSELQRLVNSIKSMATEVIDQKELFENLFENIPTGVIIYRPNIVYANKYVLKVLKTDMKTLETLASVDDLLSRSALSEKKINELKTLTDEKIKGKGEISTYETALKLGEHELDVYVVSDTIKYKGEMAGIVAFVDISELKKVGKELDLLLQYSPLAIYHTMTENKVSQMYFTSQSLYKHTGYKQNEVGTDWWFEHLHPSYMDGMVEKRKILESTRELNHIYKFRRKDGSHLYIKDQAYQINKKDEPREIIGFWDDATKDESLKRVSIALANINQMLLHVKSENEIFEKICRILVKDGPFTFAWLGASNVDNDTVETISKFGEEKGYLVNSVFDLDNPVVQRIISNKFSFNQNTLMDESVKQWKEDMLKANFFSSSSLLIKDKKNSKKYILNLYSDTTDMYFSELEKTLETLSYNVEFALKNMRNIQKLKFLSYHDSLCGLPNINAMQKELNKIIDPVSICVLNIRDFSLINLNYGYGFGDKALCAIAKNIKNSISKTDKLFRLGGDKFAILLHNVHKDLAIDIISRIKKKLSSGINIEEHFVPVYLRISLVSAPEDTLEVKTLHELGMSALGYGRESKHVILFEPWMLDLSKSRLSIERNIIDAIQNESFVVYYQPIVDAKNDTACHLEALMRLNDKDGHPISPELLAKTAEEFGTINDITRIIVQKVAKQQSLWRQNGLNLRVAINISAADIADKNFFTMLEEALIKNSIGSDAISLEVTERAAIENLEVAQEFISHARELGIKIEIDDFGVAHSSLSEISSIDFDYLKIDKSFVDKIGISIKSEKVIEFIIFLAKEFNAKTIAEGVETKEQSKWLKKAGCDFIQGYLYYRPMPAIEIEKKL